MDASARTRQPAQKKRKRGHPTDYKPEHCKSVLFFGAQGKSRHQIAALLNVAWETLRNWEKAHPEFLAAMSRARELSQAWWEDQGQKGIWSRDFNANGYRLQICNRFPDSWRDDPVKVNIQNSITVDTSRPVEEWGAAELETELARRNALPKIPALNGRK